MNFTDAKKFGENIKLTYMKLGYEVVDVLFAKPAERADFIIKKIAQFTQPNG